MQSDRSHRRHQNAIERWIRAPIVCAPLVLALAGCSLLQPYDHAAVIHPNDPTVPEGLELAGGADGALQDAEAARMLYFDNLRWSSWSKSAVAAGAIGLSGWALYNGLKPVSGAREIGDTRRAVRLGTGLAALYASKEFFDNSAHERIWAEGYRQLTCFMVQVSPLLMTQSAGIAGPGSMSRPVTTAPGHPINADEKADWPTGDVEQLRGHLQNLEPQITQVNALVALFDAKLDAVAGSGREVAAAERYLRLQSRRAKKALAYARAAHADATGLLDASTRVGRRIREGVGLIIAANNEAIQTTGSKLQTAMDLVKTSTDLTSGIKSIGIDTEADQNAVKASAASDAAAMTSPAAPTLGSTIPVAWFPVPEASRAPTVVSPTSASLRESVDSRARTSSSLKATRPRKGDARAPALAAERDFGTKDLKAIRGELAAAVKKIDEVSEARERRDAASALAKLSKDFEQQVYRRARDELDCGRSEASPKNDGACTQNLLLAVERLYELRRPVAQAVLNFRERVRQVAAAPDCADLATLHVTPNVPVRAAAGSTLEFIISQRDHDANPIAVLQGPVDDDRGASLQLEAIATTRLFKAVVKLGAEMTGRRLRLIVSDSKQRSTQVIVIDVYSSKKQGGAREDAAESDASS